MSCRDCPRCCEPLIVSLVLLPFRVLWAMLTFWNIGLFRRHCPQCRHRLVIHTKINGRYAD